MLFYFSQGDSGGGIVIAHNGGGAFSLLAVISTVRNSTCIL